MKKILFIVVEKHMMNNYTKLNSILSTYDIPYEIVYLPQYNTTRVINRIVNGHKIFKNIKEMLLVKFPKGISDALVIYSNAEGFILSNKDSWIPNMFSCKEVVLQHGLMPTKISHKKLRFMLNALSKALLGFYVLGKGFGGIKVDKAIVMGYAYVEMLVRSNGWNESDIFVSGSTLKPLLTEMPKADNDICLFLLQDLSPYYKKNVIQTYSIFSEIARILAQHYKKVIVRKHPKMQDSVYGLFNLFPNVVKSKGSLYEDFSACSRVYSFFSSALLDAYMYKKEVVAIKTKKIGDNAYLPFNRVVKYEELDGYLSKFSCVDDKAVINSSYFDTTDNTREIIAKLIQAS